MTRRLGIIDRAASVRRTLAIDGRLHPRFVSGDEKGNSTPAERNRIEGAPCQRKGSHVTADLEQAVHAYARLARDSPVLAMVRSRRKEVGTPSLLRLVPGAIFRANIHAILRTMLATTPAAGEHQGSAARSSDSQPCCSTRPAERPFDRCPALQDSTRDSAEARPMEALSSRRQSWERAN